MTDAELKEKIAKYLFHEMNPVRPAGGIVHDYWGITNTLDDESWRRLERHCFYGADQFFNFFKEAGYLSPAEVEVIKTESMDRGIKLAMDAADETFAAQLQAERERIPPVLSDEEIKLT